MLYCCSSMPPCWCSLGFQIHTSVTKKRERKKKKKEKKTLMHADWVRMQTQMGSELPSLLICTRPHSNNSQNKHTHTLWSFNRKWFTHTWINTSDRRMQILVPYIGLNKSRNYFMPDLQCTSSRIHQRFQVWPLRSDLSVFTRSIELLTHTL
jgi:hypothetical protein